MGITGKLASLQRMATLAITSALCSTTTDVLDLHADVLLVELLLNKICHRAFLWLASLAPAHPLQMLVYTCAKRYIKSHRSPLHELANMYNVAPQDIEIIAPPSHPPGHQWKHKMTIHDTAEESAACARSCRSELVLYSDGSGLGGHTGMAAIMYKARQCLKVLKLHLGSLEDHTMYEVEAVRLSLVLHLLSMERGIRSATIMLDNQSVIQSLGYRKLRTTQYLVSGLLSQFDSIFRWSRHLDFELDIAWVKGHMDIEGNELVDKAVKEAAGGKSSKVTSLPSLLATNPLPVSVSAHKQAYGASLHKRWKEIWKQSLRHARITKIYPSLPSNKFWKLMVEHSRAQASLVIQLRTGHVPLNVYLHRISKLE